MTHDLESLVVAITGAGKGLGQAYALHLAGRGARIVVNNRRHEGEARSSADQVVEAIRSAGGEAVAEYSAVEQPDSGQLLLETALHHFGRLDAVVANAGVSEHRSFRKQDLEQLQRVVEINLGGAINSLHPAFRHMYERRSGSLLLSTSAAGLYGEHGLPAYSATKAGLLGLMYSLSREGAGHGVRVNALAPYAATAMTDSALTPELRRRYAPERVAPLVAWLLSADCPISGEILVAGGGRISRASMLETEALDFGSQVAGLSGVDDRLWGRLRALPLDRRYESAAQHFAEFSRSSTKPQR